MDYSLKKSPALYFAVYFYNYLVSQDEAFAPAAAIYAFKEIVLDWKLPEFWMTSKLGEYGYSEDSYDDELKKTIDEMSKFLHAYNLSKKMGICMKELNYQAYFDDKGNIMHQRAYENFAYDFTNRFFT